jgi:membrane-associated phospholipid phosphatase
MRSQTRKLAFGFVAVVSAAVGLPVPTFAETQTRCRTEVVSEQPVTECSVEPVAEETKAPVVVRLPANPAPSPGLWKSLFTDTAQDFRRLPTANTAKWLVFGAAVAATAHLADKEVTRSLSGTTSLDDTIQPGMVIGSTPFQLGGSAIVYGLGAAMGNSRITHLGGDLFRAQLLAEGLTFGIKQISRRDRPDGTGFSFPSGHTTVSFASATVLQRHFGWRVGGPAYAIAGYVALSRVQMKRHYLSDVAFGAALGIVAGRTITLGHDRTFRLSPTVTAGGAAVSFTWIGRTT